MTMQSQSASFHETWAYLRDNAKPCSLQDVDDLREVRRQEPPSPEHIANLKRSHRGHDKPQPKAKKVLTPEQEAQRKSNLQWHAYKALQSRGGVISPREPLPEHMRSAPGYVPVKQEAPLDTKAVAWARYERQANSMRDLWRTYHGPMTREQQAVYAYICGQPDVIYVNSAGVADTIVP